MDRQPVLVSVDGPLKGARYPVDGEGISLGRDAECEVVINDPNVSRIHARLILRNAAIWVQDQGSRNGVFVNDDRVVRHRQLSPGDAMVIGEHRFTLELEEVADADTTVDMAQFRAPAHRDWRPWLVAGVVALGVVVLWLAFG